jgi:hypothetical protein
MDLTGLIGNILLSAADIDKGRKNLATDGFEHIGRIYYEDGISLALTTFKNAQESAIMAFLVTQFIWLVPLIGHDFIIHFVLRGLT